MNKNIEIKREIKGHITLTFLNTNARSLCPKIKSLIDNMNEMDAAFAVVTETWLADGVTLEEDKQDLLLGEGFSLLCRNRQPDSRGRCYGGVGLMFRDDLCNFKQIDMPNQNNYEVLTAIGTVQGLTRKIVCIGCYLPPNYTTSRAVACLQYIEELVIEMKKRLKDPYIVVSGDFNQWPVEDYMVEFRDIKETTGGPTRADRTIDRTFTNVELVTDVGTLCPLQTEEEGENFRESDHRVFYMSVKLERMEKYR